MTTSIAIALPGVSIAGADTRFSASHDNRVTPLDGPGDFPLHIHDRNRTLILPFQQRKLQLVGRGWVAYAGEVLTAQRVLEQIQQAGAMDFASAQVVAHRALLQLKDVLGSETGFSEEQMRLVVLLGAPLTAEGGCWAMRLDGAVKLPSAGPQVINWPLSVPQGIQQEATSRLQEDLQHAYSSYSIPGLLRATLAVLREGSLHGPESGPFVQLGISSLSSFLPEPVYLEGEVVELLGISDAELAARLQRPPPPRYWHWAQAPV